MYKMNGWWISPTGDIIPIINHYYFIKANPGRFGFTPEDIKTTSLTTRQEDRRHFIIEALKRGWIRVRKHKEHLTFEFWEKRSLYGRADSKLSQAYQCISRGDIEVV